MKANRTVEIGRGRKPVWDVLRDPSLLPIWFEGIEDFRAIEGDGSAVGDVYRINYTRFRKPVGLKVAVIETVERELLVQRFSGLPASFTIACALNGSARRTTLDALVEVKLSLVQRALTPIVSGYVDQLAVGLADGFKTYLEDA